MSKKIFIILEPEEVAGLRGILTDHDGEEAWTGKMKREDYVMSNCGDCGLFNCQNHFCVWFNKHLSTEEIGQGDSCHYYLDIIREEGEPLPPYQHLLLKQDDLARKKMKME